jgi:hypothetical protein
MEKRPDRGSIREGEKRPPRRFIRDGQKAPASEGGRYKGWRKVRVALDRLTGIGFLVEPPQASPRFLALSAKLG